MSRTEVFHAAHAQTPCARMGRTRTSMVEPRRGVGYDGRAGFHAFGLAELFGRLAPVTLEIGSGTGEQIVAAAAAHLSRLPGPLEVWVPGIAKLVSKAVDAGVDNIRVIGADAAQAPIMLGGHGRGLDVLPRSVAQGPAS